MVAAASRASIRRNISGTSGHTIRGESEVVRLPFLAERLPVAPEDVTTNFVRLRIGSAIKSQSRPYGTGIRYCAECPVNEIIP